MHKSHATTVIVWLKHELRVNDQPALAWAADLGARVIPVYILDSSEGIRPLGGASRWWLHQSLLALRGDLPDLVLKRGQAAEILVALARESGAKTVIFTAAMNPNEQARDAKIMLILQALGVDVVVVPGNLLCAPEVIKNGSGADFKVFTPFWRACQVWLGQHPPVTTTKPQFQTVSGVASDRLDDWGLRPTRPNWAAKWMGGGEPHWQPGEAGAWARFRAFLDHGLAGYATLRDQPALPHVSKLGAHLRFGELSVRAMWQAVQEHMQRHPELTKDGEKFLAELGWREFAHHLLHYAPDLATKNWKPAFDAYPWREAPDDLKAWQMGQTGYPLVDAGMRQLWQTGWQHNRVRMVCASFLIKHLRIDWRAGERWFWDTLVDADPANNAASWQWVAGSGADASPFFRIFNPFGQGERFDAEGAYVRQWCPELARLPNEFIHKPWEAPALVLLAAEVALGQDYPHPMVRHEDARVAAMEGYAAVKGVNGNA